MKPILVSIVISIGMLGMIMFMDLIMGTNPNQVFLKALNPFRVMEAAEYMIIFLFVTLFMIKMVGAYIRKKRNNSESTS
jgi:uncharacterized membrane protein